MAAWTAIGLAIWTAFPSATASNMTQQASTSIEQTSAWGFDLIPALILVAALILSLEIWDQTFVSRPLSATVLVTLWGTVLCEQQRMASLLAAILYHGVYEVYRESARGLPCVFQPAMQPRKSRLWSRFWLRVFVWGTTLATTSALSPPRFDSVSSFLVAPQSSLFVTVYCECTEVLLLLYFTDAPVLAAYDPRRRVLLWAASLLVGMLHHTNTLAVWAAALSQRVDSRTLVAALAVGMVVSVYVEGPSVVALMQHLKTSLQALVRAKHAGKRRSFLYRAGSDVEVVGMVSHYEAYDFHHHRDEDGEARSPV